MTDVLMPQLSDSMEQGTILTWLKPAGERVEIGEELVEIETDKATVSYAAEKAGVLEILAAEGTTIAVGEPIARLIATKAPLRPQSAPVATDASPGTKDEAQRATAPPTDTVTVAAPSIGAENGGTSRTVATPLARRIAALHGVELADVEGTGPLGRITRADVLRTAGLAPKPAVSPPVAVRAAPKPPADIPERTPLAPPSGSRRELTRVQQVIARRMAQAKATIPHFQVQTEVAMDAAVALRNELKQLAGEDGVVPSINDLVIKAAAVALRDHPLANGSYQDSTFELHAAINIGVAVAAEGALVVPTVFDAAGKSLGEIARETRRLAVRVRSGQITPPELSGGTFTISNLGMYGMTAITPVINPPQAAILGVGAMRGILARVDGEIVERRQLTLTLSCDHRILYGADAARFLASIRDLLETPLHLAL
jgi:pyruvate dehydrogenase E2 component (dihydrolipoyllysine-residue acetyltransferase)